VVRPRASFKGATRLMPARYALAWLLMLTCMVGSAAAPDPAMSGSASASAQGRLASQTPVTPTGSAQPDQSNQPDQPQPLQLAPGESLVLSAPGVARVAVGQADVLQAVVVDEREVLLFARGAGSTSLHVWTASGTRRDYLVDVEQAGARRMHEELRTLLAGIENARSVQVGNKIVIEGQNLSDADRARVALLAERYPEVVDFTSTVGWEPMVMFDVQVLEIPRYRLQELGVRWNGATEGGINMGASWDALGGRALVERAGESPLARAGTNAPFSGYLGANMLLASRVHAMVESGEAVVLAQPQLLARSGATADFLAGGEVPYTTVDGNGKTDTRFKPYGVSLQMTPRVARNGVIRAHLAVEASAVDSTVTGANGPALKTRRASTEFNVRSGRTLVLAGFLSHDKSLRRDGLPGLSELPWINRLFGTQRNERRDIELAIFVTPSIVTDDHPGMQDRVRRARTLIEASTQSAPHLNTPLAPGFVGPATHATDDDLFYGQGSQWRLSSSSAVRPTSRGMQ